MTLDRVELPDRLPAVPAEVAAFLADCHRRIDAFVDSHRDHPVPAFVPSDFASVYGVLRYLHEQHLAAGPRLCEWGSGAGVVACLASGLGYTAWGIEFEAELVDLARDVARSAGAAAQFVCGNFVPDEAQELADDVEAFDWLAVGGPDGHEQIGLGIDDFDVIFAYPWPGERAVIERLFSRFAADGALLVIYDGTEGLTAQRRRARRRRR